MTTKTVTVKNTNKNSNINAQHSSEYIAALKNILDEKLFPTNFDMWPIQEQSTWISKNIAKLFPNTPKSLLDFIPALYRQCDYGRSQEKKPEWLDMDKYRRGQKFVRDHYFSLIISKILGIMHIYSFDDALKSIIISGRSHTPYLGFKRYLSTIKRFLNFYNGEPWVKGTTAYNDMQFARKMHLITRQKLCKLDNEQINNACEIAKSWSPDHETLAKDFAATCPFEKSGQRPFLLLDKSPHRYIGLNSADIAGAQCGFVALFLLCPQNIGVHDATDEDLEAFCHMWRCYGYCLGMEDEYNFCRGSLEEIKQRTRDLYQYWILPNFKDVTPDWEHMTRCLVEPMNFYPFLYMPYKAMTLISTDILNLNMPNLYTSLNYTEWIAYKVWTFILQYALQFSTIRAIFNRITCKAVNIAMNYSPEKQIELQEKSRKLFS
ncbi:uncharacterized protein LOC114934594 [Nylanderia fulva]|uniref:uncharacterized protein LOC114934594 n=1 Tax=Nylanderia fulva TaxID=613905 RepID=UPI0010FADFA7|nr:uncharacterized protein LOC114934594 [Nylanderia fulva]